MLSFAQARAIAAKEWEENFPDEHAKLTQLLEEGAAMVESGRAMLRGAATSSPADDPVTGHTDRMVRAMIASGTMLSGVKRGSSEQDDKARWIKYRADHLVRESVK